MAALTKAAKKGLYKNRSVFLEAQFPISSFQYLDTCPDIELKFSNILNSLWILDDQTKDPVARVFINSDADYVVTAMGKIKVVSWELENSLKKVKNCITRILKRHKNEKKAINKDNGQERQDEQT